MKSHRIIWKIITALPEPAFSNLLIFFHMNHNSMIFPREHFSKNSMILLLDEHRNFNSLQSPKINWIELTFCYWFIIPPRLNNIFHVLTFLHVRVLPHTTNVSFSPLWPESWGWHEILHQASSTGRYAHIVLQGDAINVYPVYGEIFHMYYNKHFSSLVTEYLRAYAMHRMKIK